MRSVTRAPIRVAREPKIISSGAALIVRFEIKQPTKSPHDEPGTKKGIMQSASPSLTCTAPEASPATFEIQVKATYIAATIADTVSLLVLFLFI
jgi:hypothetical protein